MSQPDEYRDLVERTRKGDQEAARRLFDEYSDRLLALARRHLSPRLTRRVDPEDIVQSVFRTFFGRVKDGQFQIADDSELCRLLLSITVHKTLRQVAFQHAARRDSRREEASPVEAENHLLRLLADEPSPEVMAEFLEQFESFLNSLKTDERRIVEMRLQGQTINEIARLLGTYERKVRRDLDHIRCRAKQEGFDPARMFDPPTS